MPGICQYSAKRVTRGGRWAHGLRIKVAPWAS